MRFDRRSGSSLPTRVIRKSPDYELFVMIHFIISAMGENYRKDLETTESHFIRVHIAFFVLCVSVHMNIPYIIAMYSVNECFP